MMIFWWGGRHYTVDVLQLHGVAPLYYRGERSTLLSVVLVENTLNVNQVLSSVGCCHHSIILSLKSAFCARRVIPFDTIMVLETVFPTALVNYHPFSSCLMRWERCSKGSYAPIIFMAFSSRTILFIAL